MLTSGDKRKRALLYLRLFYCKSKIRKLAIKASPAKNDILLAKNTETIKLKFWPKEQRDSLSTPFFFSLRLDRTSNFAQQELKHKDHRKYSVENGRKIVLKNRIRKMYDDAVTLC